ncbi:uncharacterized protein LOC116852674 [Odontomachus brunneus]|uniref:uncharacterized protein LOC116852674 n=1 Tax=Odontomachus brunneus TaxID=486640 RepID=UPI0013F2110A|nr:uncharacterized protein LOC116852674 [Odontomachus brunneus]
MLRANSECRNGEDDKESRYALVKSTIKTNLFHWCSNFRGKVFLTLPEETRQFDAATSEAEEARSQTDAQAVTATSCRNVRVSRSSEVIGYLTLPSVISTHCRGFLGFHFQSANCVQGLALHDTVRA